MSENTVVVLRRLRPQMTASSITATMIRMTMDALVHVKMIVTGSSEGFGAEALAATVAVSYTHLTLPTKA